MKIEEDGDGDQGVEVDEGELPATDQALHE